MKRTKKSFAWAVRKRHKWETMTDTRFDQQRQWREQYVARINRVQDYIEQHLAEPLSLERLAGVANFSRFHFHRIFQAMVGETLNQFISRIRGERAASTLLAAPHKSITEVALDCGFGSLPTFARVFKEQFGMSASAFRASHRGDRGRDGKEVTAHRVAKGPDPRFEVSYLFGGPTTQRWQVTTGELRPIPITVETLPRMHLIYVRHVGPYAGQSAVFAELFNRLLKWAGPRELVGLPDQKSICIYHDDPGITEEQKLRVSMGLTVPPEVRGEGEVSELTLAGGKYVVAEATVNVDQFGSAWDAVMAGWLPQSGYQCDDGPCFELYGMACDTPPFQVKICVPVRPL